MAKRAARYRQLMENSEILVEESTNTWKSSMPVERVRLLIISRVHTCPTFYIKVKKKLPLLNLHPKIRRLLPWQLCIHFSPQRFATADSILQIILPIALVT